jgi:hypothetical protein
VGERALRAGGIFRNCTDLIRVIGSIDFDSRSGFINGPIELSPSGKG